MYKYSVQCAEKVFLKLKHNLHILFGFKFFQINLYNLHGAFYTSVCNKYIYGVTSMLILLYDVTMSKTQDATKAKESAQFLADTRFGLLYKTYAKKRFIIESKITQV